MQQFAPSASWPRTARARLRKDVIWLLVLKVLALVVLFLILNAGPARHEPTPEAVGAHLAAGPDPQ